MSNTPYRKIHVLDFNIEDENSNLGRDITISVDSLEMVNIEIGNAVIIRTDEEGIDMLREALHRAMSALENTRYENTTARLAAPAEDDMVQSGIDAREKLKTKKQMKDTEPPKIDVYGDYYDPNDPVNW